MPAQIVNSNNNFLGRLVEGFTGIEHDATLSGNGTTGSPLGCIKECTVHTDNTLSGDGSQASPLGCLLTETFTAVDHDGNLTGDGNTTPLGLSTSISAGELVMGNGQIKYTDGIGDVYVNATKVRNWDSLQPGMNGVNHNNTLSGDGTTTAMLGVVDNLKFAAALGSPDLSRASATIEPERILSPSTMEYMKLQLTNDYGNTRNYTLIPSDINAGYLYANGAGPIVSKSIKGNTAFESATSGAVFYGNDDWSALASIKMHSLDEAGSFSFNLPAKTTIDIAYNAVIGTFGEDEPMKFDIGLTFDGQSAFVDSAPIVFPGAIVDEHGYGSTSTNFHTNLRYKNDTNNAVTLNLSINAHGMGSLDENASWWVSDDRLLGRIYDN